MAPHLTSALTIAWLPPRGYSRKAAGLNHSLNMKATSAAMVPSAGRPAHSRKRQRLSQCMICSSCLHLPSAPQGTAVVRQALFRGTAAPQPSGDAADAATAPSRSSEQRMLPSLPE